MARSYQMQARAMSVEDTGRRILEAALDHFRKAHFDEITLNEIAADAGVSVQTVIRRFGSKQDLLEAVADGQALAVTEQRGSAPVGDVAGAVVNLVAHYEAHGDTSMHLLRQEKRVAALGQVADAGKRFHERWVRHVFAPWLMNVDGADRRRLHAQLVAVCDVYTWHLLRRQRGLSRRQTELAFTELLEGLLS